MTDLIYTGNFGTPGGVAYFLLAKGLDNVGGLAASLVSKDIVISTLYVPENQAIIAKILSEITDTDDLKTIQDVVESTIPNMKSPLDYTSIDASAGMVNDSAFVDMAEVGRDLYNKSQYMAVKDGAKIVEIIDGIKSTYSPYVEQVATTDKMVNSQISNQLYSYLPKSSESVTASLLDVIGTASGYYAGNIKAINDAVSQLETTGVNFELRRALQRMASTVNHFAGGIAYHNNQNYITEYENLTGAIKSETSGIVPVLVEEINSNYEYIWERIQLENYNWNLANIITVTRVDRTPLMSFVLGLHEIATEDMGLKSYTVINGISQPDATGSVIRAILEEGKNYLLLRTIDVQPNGYVD